VVEVVLFDEKRRQSNLGICAKISVFMIEAGIEARGRISSGHLVYSNPHVVFHLIRETFNRLTAG